MNYNFQNEKCFRCQGTGVMLDEVNKESATCTYCNLERERLKVRRERLKVEKQKLYYIAYLTALARQQQIYRQRSLLDKIENFIFDW